MHNFLLEIGTEELPPHFAIEAGPQLEKLVKLDLEHNRLNFNEIFCSSTPRRIVLIIYGLSAKAEDDIQDIKGPPYNKAFIDGVPTQAANGFARRFNLSADQLDRIDTPKGPFTIARVVKKGNSARDILELSIPLWIKGLQGKRFMKWGQGDFRFSRPIRWIVSLLDENIISFNLNGFDDNVLPGNITRGSRLNQNLLKVSSVSDYESLLKDSGVIINRESRKLEIKKQVNQAAQSLDSQPDMPNSLLEELTDLVEKPLLIECSFDPSFLTLPLELLTTVMRVHQRYIPLLSTTNSYDQLSLDSLGLLNSKFLCISNGLKDAISVIREGNERVIKARFSDAKYFIDLDKSISSSTRILELKEVTFTDGLGSLYDRVMRISWISNKLADYLDLQEQQRLDLEKSSYFCKNDLVSNIVSEFPELQGVMGAKYLLIEGQTNTVALAVLEQYMPTYSGADLPSSFIGSLLSISDKVELIISIFSKGQRPSGSSDPYALRRSANGIIQIIIKNQINIDLYNLIKESVSYWSDQFPEFLSNNQQTLSDLHDFFRTRLLSTLEELDIDPDLGSAVAGETISINRILSDLTDIFNRANILSDLRKKGTLKELQEVVARATRLAENSTLDSETISSKNLIDINLFEKQSEFDLLEFINEIEPMTKDRSSSGYQKLAQKLLSGFDVLKNFFDGEFSVMVMAEDQLVRNNRLNLLALIRNQSSVIADFSRIS